VGRLTLRLPLRRVQISIDIQLAVTSLLADSHGVGSSRVLYAPE
jgi:hypothetical protein